MTKIGRLIEEEKLEYAQKYAKECEQNIARKMLAKGMNILEIMELPMLSKSEILALQNEPSNT